MTSYIIILLSWIRIISGFGRRSSMFPFSPWTTLCHLKRLSPELWRNVSTPTAGLWTTAICWVHAQPHTQTIHSARRENNVFGSNRFICTKNVNWLSLIRKGIICSLEISGCVCIFICMYFARDCKRIKHYVIIQHVLVKEGKRELVHPLQMFTFHMYRLYPFVWGDSGWRRGALCTQSSMWTAMCTLSVYGTWKGSSGPSPMQKRWNK